MVFRAEQQHFPGVKPVKKKEKKATRGDGRRAIVALFIITVLASFLFYLQAEAPKIWQRITAPQIISHLPKNYFDPNPVLDQIEELTQNLSGTYGVYVYRLRDGKDYGFNQEETFPTASLNKLPVMIAAYQQAEAGKIDLETEYTLQETDKVQGAGLLQSKPAGTKYSYRQLLELMGQSSDNTAFKVMRRVTGEGLIEQATPEKVGFWFKKLYQDKIITDEHRDELLDFLTETDFEDRISQGLPEEVRVAHKIGTLEGVYADAGLVFAEEPFILVIMTEDAQEKEALKVLPQITQVIWDFETAL